MLLCVGVLALAEATFAEPSQGLDRQAKRELVASGVTRYLGQFTPAASTDVGEGWVKHTFAPGLDQGPMCIAGTPYSMFTLKRDPRKLLIMLQGGGACWQDFYACNVLAEAQEPPPPPVGIWSDGFDTGAGTIPNPLADWSVAYLPYCDGSVFSGDNAVVDPAFQAFIEEQLGLPAGEGPPVRFHRGMRNLTAGIDVAHSTFPRARRILLAGSSAGGVGAAAFAPFIVRFAYGDTRELRVLNDAGPNAVNLLDIDGILARAADWRFGQFYPASCTACDELGQGTGIVKWRLEHDRTIREGFYSTDADTTNRFFLKVPTQELYRGLIVSEHGEIHAAFPNRYKRFIRSGDTTHTALQTPLYFLGTANGLPLILWVDDFVKPDWWLSLQDRIARFAPPELLPLLNQWQDVVEDFAPAPAAIAD